MHNCKFDVGGNSINCKQFHHNKLFLGKTSQSEEYRFFLEETIISV